MIRPFRLEENWKYCTRISQFECAVLYMHPYIQYTPSVGKKPKFIHCVLSKPRSVARLLGCWLSRFFPLRFRPLLEKRQTQRRRELQQTNNRRMNRETRRYFACETAITEWEATKVLGKWKKDFSFFLRFAIRFFVAFLLLLRVSLFKKVSFFSLFASFKACSAYINTHTAISA